MHFFGVIMEGLYQVLHRFEIPWQSARGAFPGVHFTRIVVVTRKRFSGLGVLSSNQRHILVQRTYNQDAYRQSGEFTEYSTTLLRSILWCYKSFPPAKKNPLIPSLR